MSHLRYSDDNTVLTCGCGAIKVYAHNWNVMTEHKRLALKQAAEDCWICKAHKREGDDA